jgi:hypothetical protein
MSSEELVGFWDISAKTSESKLKAKNGNDSSSASASDSERKKDKRSRRERGKGSSRRKHHEERRTARPVEYPMLNGLPVGFNMLRPNPYKVDTSGDTDERRGMYSPQYIHPHMYPHYAYMGPERPHRRHHRKGDHSHRKHSSRRKKHSGSEKKRSSRRSPSKQNEEKEAEKEVDRLSKLLDPDLYPPALAPPPRATLRNGPSTSEGAIKKAQDTFDLGSSDKRRRKAESRKSKERKESRKSKEPTLTEELIQEGANRLAAMDLDETSIRISRKRQKHRRRRRRQERANQEEGKEAPLKKETTELAPVSSSTIRGPPPDKTEKEAPVNLSQSRPKVRAAGRMKRSHQRRNSLPRNVRINVDTTGKKGFTATPVLEEHDDDGAADDEGKVPPPAPVMKERSVSFSDESPIPPSASPRSAELIGKREEEVTGSTKPVVKKETRKRNARRMSLLNVASSGIFRIRIVNGEMITGCYIRYTNESETKLCTRSGTTASRAEAMSTISLWKDKQTGKNTALSIQGVHLVPFLNVADLFEVLEKRYLDNGREKGGEFDIDDYSSDSDSDSESELKKTGGKSYEERATRGKIPSILKGLEIFKYAEVMRGDDGMSFDNKTRMMRARDVYARLLKDCSIHKHRYVGYVIAAITPKLNPKTVGELMRHQHEEIVQDCEQSPSSYQKSPIQTVAGCVLSNRYCPYYEETVRLKEDLLMKRSDLNRLMNRSDESITIIKEYAGKMEKFLEEKLEAERDATYYRGEWEEATKALEESEARLKDAEEPKEESERSLFSSAKRRREKKCKEPKIMM